MPDASNTYLEPRPSLGEALRFWLKLGCISFGGPAGQIAIMQHELVDRRQWIDQRSFLLGLNFCTLLPGPEATQLASYIGWRLHGVLGAVAAGTLFVVPGALVLLVLSWIAAAKGDTPVVGAIFYGLKPVVIAIIAHAVWRIGRRTLKNWQSVALAIAAFLGIFAAGVDFPWIVIAAGAIGWLAGRRGHSPFATVGHGPKNGDDSDAATPPASAMKRLTILVSVFVVLWIVPVGLTIALFGARPFLGIAELFTKAAFVTFGGAYAVLPYVAEEAVRTYAWLAPGEMLNGLALAETTPGPLILVLQYVGFFAGWNHPDGLPQAASAIIGATLTTYVTFLPSFMFILAGAPYIAGLGDRPALGSALGAITAAVVGVILNLGVFLAREVFLPAEGVDWASIALALAALLAMLRFNIAIHWYVAAGAAVGLAFHFLAAQ
ncbi:MAG TPA: chromate efflux transporter [Alphaproteobacteria bacterium]|nr:chromate efflux transporter [Alphaproteobacteria bacterium]